MGGPPGGAAPLLLALAIAATERRRRSTALLMLAAAMLLGIGGAETTTEGTGGAERGPRRPRRRRLPPRGGPPRLEVVEGCFNRFDALAEVPVNEDAIVGHFNNIRCQVACAERGYALAATRSCPRACLCGNDYPSAFHQLDAGKCDAPCNPDQASCLLFTCCGDRNGTHFTVSFAQQQDVVLQVLRQIAFDYRTSSPTFRGEIEGELVDASPLRIVAGTSGGNGGGGEDGQWYFLAGPAGGAVAEECWGNDDGGSGWASFEGTCYKLHWAQSVAQEEARQQCLHDAAGSDLVVPTSAAQNAFVAQLQGGCQGWLGARFGDGESAWTSSGHFHNFTEGEGDGTGTGCVQLAPDGGWVRAPCGAPSLLLRHHQHHPGSQNADCFVCQKARVSGAGGSWGEAPATIAGADTDTWRLIECPQQQEAEGIGLRLQHEASGRFLGCSRESGRLVLLKTGEGEGRSTIVARVDEDDGSFTLTQGSLAVALDEEGRLTCRPLDPQHKGGWVDGGPAVARFQPTCMLRVLAWRHLRLSVVVLSSDLQMRGWRECSVAAYDTTPTTVSYRCQPVPSVPAGIDEMWLEQQALLVSDLHRWLLPRYPLPLGRLRCVNEHPRTSAICTLAYGQGVTTARAITIDWNTFIADTISTRCNVQAALTANFPLPPAAAFGGGGGGGDGGDGGDGGGDGGSNNAFAFQTAALKELANDFTVIYSQFYEVAVVRAYVETRNWQTSIRSRPLSTITAQLWLEQVRLTYRWRALFQARGSFRVTYCGRPVGGQHSIGDLVNYDDVFFFVFGHYDVPQQASIVLTIDDRDESHWPLELPETSIVDEPFFFPHGRRRQR